MTLHPQIAALAAQLEDLAALLRSRGDRRWSGKIELCAHLVADSNFTGVEHFLDQAFADVQATWQLSGHGLANGERRAAVRPLKAPPEGVVVRYEPDSVMVRRAGS